MDKVGLERAANHIQALIEFGNILPFRELVEWQRAKKQGTL